MKAETLSINEQGIEEQLPERSPKRSRLPSWQSELKRRRRHLQGLLEAEEANRSAAEPWRLKLIQRALFITWMDEREEKARHEVARAA